MTKSDDKRVPVLRFKGFTDEWEQRKLGDLTQKIKSYPISHDAEINTITGTKYIHYGDIHTGKLKRITNEKILPNINDNNYIPLKSGDVIVADASEDYKGIADACVIDLMKEHYKIVSGLHTIVFRPNERLKSDFLYTYFHTPIFKHYGYRVGTGLKVFGITYNNLSNMEIKLPKIDEQNKVYKIINIVTNIITLQQRKLELLKAIKKAGIQQISKQKLIIKDEVNNKYVSINVGKTFKVTRGNVLSKENISPCKTNSTPYPVYSSQTKNDGLLGYFDRYLFENAITWTTDGANAGTVKFRSGKFFSTNVSGVLISNNGYANEINAEILNSVTYKYVSHVGNPKLMNNVMKDINITIPSTKSLQNKFSNFILNLKININKQEEKIQNYKFIKQFLLQNMFI